MIIKKSSKWFYKGPVKLFQETRSPSWEGVTWAPSEGKALANLSYQYKKEKGLSVVAKITLSPNYLVEISTVDDYIYYDEEMRRIINESVQM